MESVTAWLNTLEDRLEAIASQMCAAQWTLYCDGDRGQVDQKTHAFQSAFGSTETWKKLRDLRRQQSTLSPEISRRIELLYRLFSREHVRSEPQISELVTNTVSQMTTFRAQLDETAISDAELQSILRDEPDRTKRESAWKARAQLAQTLKQPVLELAALRNQAAGRLGFGDFREIGFLVADIDCNELKQTLKHLKQHTDSTWQDWLEQQKQSLNVESLSPWDLDLERRTLSQVLSQGLPKSHIVKHMKHSFGELGIDVDRPELLLDLESRDGKSQHAYCFPVNPPHDVRVLANLRDGHKSCETLFHEMGHAVQALSVKQRFYSLKDTPNDALSEGCAQLFAYLCHDYEWLKQVLKVQDKTVKQIQTHLRHKRLASMRWMLVWVELEEAIFDCPTQDPTAYFWDLCEDIIGLKASKQVRSNPVWARVPHFVTHPFYVQNYVLADLVAAQLKSSIIQRFGAFGGCSEVGPWVISHCFEGGAQLDFDQWLINCTGKTLDLSSYLEDVVDGFQGLA
jgi:peptidyl-dipeptidase A